MATFAIKQTGGVALLLAGILCMSANPALAAAEIPTGFAPNANVGWISISGDYIQPPSGAGPVVEDPTVPHVSNEEFRRTGRQPTIAVGDPNSAILQPWAKEALRKHNQIVLAGKGGLSRQAACWPVGVPAFDLHGIHPLFVVQGPKEVLMIWQGDHQVRHIYLTAKHSANVKPSWFGESIGHYEGDVLVVDTIGLNTRTFVDGFQTPHSEQLHVVEHFRVIQGGKFVEIAIHVEDPGAYTMAWNAVQRWRRVEPGVAENDIPLTELSSSAVAGPLHEIACAENPGSYFGGSIPIPQADKPDF
jgi:hypothetical protein